MHTERSSNASEYGAQKVYTNQLRAYSWHESSHKMGENSVVLHLCNLKHRTIKTIPRQAPSVKPCVMNDLTPVRDTMGDSRVPEGACPYAAEKTRCEVSCTHGFSTKIASPSSQGQQYLRIHIKPTATSSALKHRQMYAGLISSWRTKPPQNS
jgi:hypothetical protein